MLIPEDLLPPISGANPSGEDLRYDPVYDQIREARREESDAAQGDWQRERKKADPRLVIKLCSETLSSRSKDLQVAVWLTEALVRTEGFGGLRRGIALLAGLLERYWDSLYPAIDDGDPGFRAAPLDWLGGARAAELLRRVPVVTRGGLDWFAYGESRTVGYEKDAEGNDDKLKARESAIADLKTTAEVFDAALTGTPKAFYEQMGVDQQSCLESLDSLNRFCEEKFGRDAPSFSPLRAALEELSRTTRTLLTRKREQDPDKADAAGESSEPEDAARATEEAEALGESAPHLSVSKKSKTADPENIPDAFQRVVVLAKYLRQASPYSPVPYLLLRALRWGELRASGDNPEAACLEAPSSELRKRLRQSAAEGEWHQVLQMVEDAMAQPCGRAWLDLQRYATNAMRETDSAYEPCRIAIEAELRALLVAYPALPEMSLNDETPTASPDTREWIRQLVAVPKSEIREAPCMDEERGQGAQAQVADAFELARRALSSGRADEAIQILMSELALEQTGRARFQRKVQIARICVDAGLDRFAFPILESLAAEVDDRKLEEWETREMVAYPLSLLLRCMRSVKQDPLQEDQIFKRLCRLDPVQALELGR